MLFTSADISSWVGTLVWPFTRIAAMLAIAPIFGARIVPLRVRLVCERPPDGNQPSPDASEDR